MANTIDIEYIAGRCDLNEETGCWEWSGMTDSAGYGLFRMGGRAYRAHRASYYASRYEWPDICRHLCHNRICCNPLHLATGTQKENMADRDRAGRGRWHNGPDHYMSKLSPAEARQIIDLIRYGFKQGDISKWYEVNQTTISNIKLGKHWTSKININY